MYIFIIYLQSLAYMAASSSGLFSNMRSLLMHLVITVMMNALITRVLYSVVDENDVEIVDGESTGQ